MTRENYYENQGAKSQKELLKRYTVEGLSHKIESSPMQGLSISRYGPSTTRSLPII